MKIVNYNSKAEILTNRSYSEVRVPTDHLRNSIKVLNSINTLHINELIIKEDV